MNRSRLRWLLVVCGVVLWILVVYPAYYLVHKPLNSAQFAALANVAGDLGTWLAMLGVAAALGSRLTRRLAYDSLLERLVFSTGLGLLIFSLATLALGLTGLLYRWLFWVLLVALGLLLWREFRDLGQALRQIQVSRPRGAWNILLVSFIAATLLLALAITLVPPTEWDSLVYHLVGPARYLQAHRVTFDFDNYYLFFPSFAEMLFTAGMALKGDIVPRLLHFSYLLLTLGALYSFARRYWTRPLGLVSVALFASIPTAIQIATWSYVDLTLTFYGFAALYALLNWLPLARQESEFGDNQAKAPALLSPAGWLLVAGLFCGAALSVKYTAVVSLLTVGVVMLWEVIRRRLSVRRFLAGGLVVAGLALIVASPWYIKNAIIAGNPLYPLILGGKGWNEIATRWLLVPGQEMSLLDLLVVPWTLTVIGRQGSVLFDATYSPLFLALLPLLIIVPRRARGLGQLLLAAIVGYAFWIISGAAAYGTFVLRGRQVLPIFAPLSLLCAYSLDGLRVWDRESFSLRRVVKMIVGLTLIVGLLSQMLTTVGLNPAPYLVGQQSRDEYLGHYTSQRLHQTASYLNDNLPENGRVLFVWEPRSYGVKVPHKADVLLDNFAQRLDRYGSPEAVLDGLRQEGFSHVLVNQYVYPWIVSDFPITPQEQAGWETFMELYLTEETLVHEEGEYLYLYRLPSGAGP